MTSSLPQGEAISCDITGRNHAACHAAPRDHLDVVERRLRLEARRDDARQPPGAHAREHLEEGGGGRVSSATVGRFLGRSSVTVVPSWSFERHGGPFLVVNATRSATRDDPIRDATRGLISRVPNHHTKHETDDEATRAAAAAAAAAHTAPRRPAAPRRTDARPLCRRSRRPPRDDEAMTRRGRYLPRDEPRPPLRRADALLPRANERTKQHTHTAIRGARRGSRGVTNRPRGVTNRASRVASRRVASRRVAPRARRARRRARGTPPAARRRPAARLER